MVLEEDVNLPENKKLTVKEINLSTATLLSAGPHVGKACEIINHEYMLCRYENDPDPRPCVQIGMLVTECAMKVFWKIKKHCLQEFNQYANCIDKSSMEYRPWMCRKTQFVFDKCMKDKLCIDRPHWGYFTRARVHDAGCVKPQKAKACVCEPFVLEGTPQLPDCKKRYPARFTSRLYWVTE